ncbi:hypothetical protein IAR50_005669 [Cryptococcus sp. DSM 104548]
MSFEKPRLHLDFNSPSYPPNTYSPTPSPTTSPSTPPATAPFSGFASQPYTSPFSPTRRSMSASPSPSSPTMSEKSDAQSVTRSPPRIVMGAMVSVSPSPRSGSASGAGKGYEEWEEECSLEVPGIVLTEPSHVDPRPRPPPKQTVLLAPTSLPLPPPGAPSPYSHSSQSSISSKSKHQFSPAFLSFLHGSSPNYPAGGMVYTPAAGVQAQGQRRTRLKAVILMGVVVLGAWHLWTSLVGDGLSGLVEEAVDLI